MHDVKIGSNRSFGIVFFVVFLIIATYPLINGDELRLWSLVTSIVFLFLGLINSKILNPLNKLWFKFGIFLGKIISPLVMSIIFFLVVTPIGFLMRIFSKNFMNLNKNNDKSYWIVSNERKSKMKDQF